MEKEDMVLLCRSLRREGGAAQASRCRRDHQILDDQRGCKLRNDRTLVDVLGTQCGPNGCSVHVAARADDDSQVRACVCGNGEP